MLVTDRRFVPATTIESIKLGDIPVGTTFEANIGCRMSHAFLRTYSEVVSLGQPGSTWSDPNIEFESYRPLKVEVVIHGYA